MVVRSPLVITCIALVLMTAAAGAGESEYYRVVTLPLPDDVAFEVSGLARLADGRLAAAIRRGEVWVIDGVHDDPPANVRYRRFASGLHEPLGLAYHDGALYLAQRTELTRLRDRDGDGVADEYLTVASGWGVSGNYHEYAYGPVIDSRGDMWITLNCTLGKRLRPDNAWRGWSIRVRPDGSWAPVSAGMRSPCGIGINMEGDVFYTEQQGNWTPTCSLHHIQPGVFHGHVDALEHCNRPESPLAHPGKIPSGIPIGEAVSRVSALGLPAVWFPYRKMGRGSTDVICDTTAGKFGPFAGQLFVGDFTLSLISRVFLEKVAGAYQGACFPFRRGLDCAVLRMEWGRDGSMFVGETNRGWNSLGPRSYGLQRLVWTGRVPFEIRQMRVLRNGFRLIFTLPVDRASASRVDSYRMTSYTYTYHAAYGSPEIDTAVLSIESAAVSADGRTVDFVVAGLREGYVHELHADGLRAASGAGLLHPDAYYTLNRLP